MIIRDSYNALFIYIIVSFLLVIVLYSLSFLISPKLNTVQKLSIYECGFDSISTTHVEFNVKFYLVALLFVIFDLEIVFLFPWSVYLGSLNLFSFYTMMYFLVMLLIGFLYEYKKGALEW